MAGPKKSISLYHNDDVETYDRAVTLLEQHGEIDGDTPQGKQLVAMSTVVIDKYGQQEREESTTDSRKRRVPWDTLSFAFSILGTLLAVGLFLGSVIYLASHFIL